MPRGEKNTVDASAARNTVSHMSAVLNIRLDDDLQALLDRACELAGRTRSDLARDALRRQLTLAAFEELRREAIPHAAKLGFKTDEDVFAVIS